MEINAVPKKHGWDEEKFMYWADAAGYAFIDSTAEGKDGNRISGFNQYSVLDATLGVYIGQMFELLKMVKEEWEDTLGITRQRKGQTNSSDAVGVTERAVFQSSVMSEEIFRRFRSFEQRELQGLVDVSKIAWKEGKKGSFINSEYKQVSLNIDPIAYKESELGIFVSNSSEDALKLEALRNSALGFAQNGSMPSTIAEILDAGNFLKIKQKLKEIEDTQQKMAQQSAQAEQANLENIEQMRIEDREDQQAFESIEKEKDRNLQRELASMKDKEIIPEDNSVDREKLSVEREKISSSERIKEKEINSKEKISSAKNQSDQKIASSRPKPNTNK
jgi:hypothetical protein